MYEFQIFNARRKNYVTHTTGSLDKATLAMSLTRNHQGAARRLLKDGHVIVQRGKVEVTRRSLKTLFGRATG